MAEGRAFDEALIHWQRHFGWRAPYYRRINVRREAYAGVVLRRALALSPGTSRSAAGRISIRLSSTSRC